MFFKKTLAVSHTETFERKSVSSEHQKNIQPGWGAATTTTNTNKQKPNKYI